MLEKIRNERILFSPLNWGMGHVSRSIPLLRQLFLQGNEIHIACNTAQLQVYKEYFGQAVFVPWDGYPFLFQGKGNFAWDILQSMPKLVAFGKKEKSFVANYVSANEITMVLSDHRYYFRSSHVPSIFVTHQLNLPLPWYLKIAQVFHLKKINQFSACWIVDDEKLNLAGVLSKPDNQLKIPHFYLGLLSRFSSYEWDEKRAKTWTTVLVSGPEPYAHLFYENQKKRFKSTLENVCILYNGQCEVNNISVPMSWTQMDERLLHTKKLISRSGYSTLMDCVFLNCETEWHPTPGQWEQEYLSDL